jgi:hypothetical protein
MSIFRSSEKQPEPVKVAFANNVTESDLIRGILKDEGIPSITRKPNGTFLTDLFGIGAREILVPAAAEADAIRILADYESAPADSLPGS